MAANGVQFTWQGIAAAVYGSASARLRWGTAPLPAGKFRLFDGAIDGACNQIAVTSFGVAASGAWEYDLRGGGGELDLVNRGLSLASLKLLLVVVTDPAATKSLWFGPQNRSNTAQLWFNGVVAADRCQVRDYFWQSDRQSGWAVSSGNGKIALTNPGSVTVAGTVLVAGVKT